MEFSTLLFVQNENVNRPYTSESKVADLRRPDRRTAMKVLVKKTYKFVDLLWHRYVETNRTDVRFVKNLCCVYVDSEDFSFTRPLDELDVVVGEEEEDGGDVIDDGEPVDSDTEEIYEDC